jgi:hypothetical protein
VLPRAAIRPRAALFSELLPDFAAFLRHLDHFVFLIFWGQTARTQLAVQLAAHQGTTGCIAGRCVVSGNGWRKQKREGGTGKQLNAAWPVCYTAGTAAGTATGCAASCGAGCAAGCVPTSNLKHLSLWTFLSRDVSQAGWRNPALGQSQTLMANGCRLGIQGGCHRGSSKYSGARKRGAVLSKKIQLQGNRLIHKWKVSCARRSHFVAEVFLR